MTKYALRLLVAQGALEHLSRGVYRASHLTSRDDPQDSYRAATIVCGRLSAICLLSALEHYNLTDAIPQKTWVMVPHTKRVIDKTLKLVRCRNPHWDIGIVKHDGYAITSLERTLVDALLYKRMIGSDTALRAIKTALQKKLPSLGKIYDMAKVLKVEHRIREAIEALAA